MRGVGQLRRTNKMNLSNYGKFQVIRTLSPYFTPKEIEQTTGIKQRSVYYYVSKFGLDTYKDTQQALNRVVSTEIIEGKIQALKELEAIQENA